MKCSCRLPVPLFQVGFLEPSLQVTERVREIRLDNKAEAEADTYAAADDSAGGVSCAECSVVPSPHSSFRRNFLLLAPRAS